MTLQLAIVGGVVGILIGLRYKVGILVRAVVLAMVCAISVELSRGGSFWSAVLTTAAVVTAVQLGYAAGAAIYAVIAAIFPPEKDNGNSDQDLSMQHFQPLDAGWMRAGRVAR